MVNFTFINTEGTQIRLTWLAVPNAVNYQVYRRNIDTEADFTVLEATAGIIFEDFGDYMPELGIYGLSNGIYIYKVEAFNNSGAVIKTDYTRKISIATINRIGYFFRNFQSDTVILTPDDMRYTMFWGNDLVAGSNEDEYSDEQITHRIIASVADWERWLNMDITKKVLKCQPDPSLIEGVEYDGEVDPFPFVSMEWENKGFLCLGRAPIISIDRALLISPTGEVVQDITDWARLQKKTGIINFQPRIDSSFTAQGIVGYNLLGTWRSGVDMYPEGFRIDFTAGYKSMALIPEDLRAIVAKWAAVVLLDETGDGLLAGFSAASNSIDGLSQSFSSTQSATSAYFGARIKSYMDEMKLYWQNNKYKFNIPMRYI